MSAEHLARRNNIKRTFLTGIALTALVFAGSYDYIAAEIVMNPDGNTLWIEDGKNIDFEPKWPAPKWGGKGMEMRPAEGGGFVVATGESSVTGCYIQVDPAYPWLVWSVRDVKQYPEGYHAFTGPYIVSKGRLMHQIMQVSYMQTGLFVIDMRQSLGDLSPAGTRYLRMDLYNSALTFDYIKVVKRPANVIELESPAFKQKQCLDSGDALTFRVSLAEPAEDVSLRFYNGYCMPRINLNDSPSLQLKPEDKEGKVWSAAVTVKSASGGKVDPELGYKPGCFQVKAVVLGGGLKVPLWTSNAYNFNIVGGK